MAYAPFIDLFSSYFGLTTDLGGGDHYDTITNLTQELLPDTFQEVSPFIGTLLGVNPTGEAAEKVKYLQPPQVRERVFSAALAFVEQAGCNQAGGAGLRGRSLDRPDLAGAARADDVRNGAGLADARRDIPAMETGAFMALS